VARLIDTIWFINELSPKGYEASGKSKLHGFFDKLSTPSGVPFLIDFIKYRSLCPTFFADTQTSVFIGAALWYNDAEGSRRNTP
jgi:hypothetical protein